MSDRGGTCVYDADCGFCTRCADWLGRHGSATLQPWQTLDLAPLGLTEDDVRREVHWLDPDGHVGASGARAIAAALRSCRGGWPLLGVLLDLAPVRPLAALAYRLVARYRYRLPGSTDACRL